MQNGKGSKPRPIKNYLDYIDNWSSIEWGNSNTCKKSKKTPKSQVVTKKSNKT